MDASTTIPTAKANPASEITFMDKPSPAIATKVPITEIGIAIKIIKVGKKERRNRIKTNNAKDPPTQIFCLTKFKADKEIIMSALKQYSASI